MREKKNIFYFLENMYETAQQRKIGTYIFFGATCLCAVGVAIFAFAGLLTGLQIFAWLCYGAMGIAIIIGIIGVIWHIQTALKTDQ